MIMGEQFVRCVWPLSSFLERDSGNAFSSGQATGTGAPPEPQAPQAHLPTTSRLESLHLNATKPAPEARPRTRHSQRLTVSASHP